MAKEDRIIRIARAILDYNDKQNMVAVVVKSGRLLAIGQNDMTRSHPVYFNGDFDKGVHAEYDALRKLKHQDITGAKMYVMYFKKDQSLGDSKPCEDCQRIIDDSDIGSVFYREEDEWCKL